MVFVLTDVAVGDTNFDEPMLDIVTVDVDADAEPTACGVFGSDALLRSRLGRGRSRLDGASNRVEADGVVLVVVLFPQTTLLEDSVSEDGEEVACC